MNTMKLPPVVGVVAMLLATAEVFAQEPAAAPKPESTGEFLKRMQPVLERDAAVEKIKPELPKITVPFNFTETPLSAVLEKMNESIRAHNAHPDTLRVPLIRIDPAYLRGTPEYEKLKPAPNFGVDGKMPMTLDLGNISLEKGLESVGNLSGTVPRIEPDCIWLVANAPKETILARQSYYIPASICATKEEAGKWLNKGLAASNAGGASWDFDAKSHVLVLRQSNIYIREFEKRYAMELLRHGFRADGK